MKEFFKKGTITPLKIITIIFALLLILFVIYTSHNTIDNMNIDNQYRHIILDIESSAEKYAIFENISQPILITVNKLIKEGYIKATEGENLLNPKKDEVVMNCHTVFIEPINNKYNIKYNEENDCRLLEYENDNISLKALSFKNGNIVNQKEVINDDVFIQISNPNNISEVTWYINNEKTEVTDASILINPKEPFRGTITAEFKWKDIYKHLEFELIINKSVQ